jgi:aspartate dehydrogenase
VGSRAPGERHIGLIGYGAIGRELAGALLADPSDRYRISLLARSSVRPEPDSDRLVCVDDFLTLADPPELVVEAAGQAAVADVVPALLAAGIPVVLASVGALSDDALRARLERLAEDHAASLILPSGAVGGLDYLRAAAIEGATEVRYTSRKPPGAWRDELAARGLKPEEVADEIVLFEGCAREAAKRYPKNLNVAAALAIAGIGMENTKVRILVDPKSSANAHEIEISGPLGRAGFAFVNTPSPGNPKTSRITTRSLHSAVRDFFAHTRRSPAAAG